MKPRSQYALDHFSERTRNVLFNAGIDSYNTIAQYSRDEIRNLKGVGPKIFKEIEDEMVYRKLWQ